MTKPSEVELSPELLEKHKEEINAGLAKGGTAFYIPCNRNLMLALVAYFELHWQVTAKEYMKCYKISFIPRIEKIRIEIRKHD